MQFTFALPDKHKYWINKISAVKHENAGLGEIR